MTTLAQLTVPRPRTVLFEMVSFPSVVSGLFVQLLMSVMPLNVREAPVLPSMAWSPRSVSFSPPDCPLMVRPPEPLSVQTASVLP